MSRYTLPATAAGTRLAPILQSVVARADERRIEKSLADLQAEVQPDLSRRQRFLEALNAPGVSVIAECKRRSPATGMLADEKNLLERAQRYADGGAAALSILTEVDHFRGGLAELHNVADSGLPRLRKDFILDAGMVLESIPAGADAILLLAVCLPDPLLGELRKLAGDLGLAVLLEVHDPGELDRALAVEPDCLGINARNLTTFEVDLATTEQMLPMVPSGFVRVAESGLRTVADVVRVREAGADAVLIGEALMKAPDPAALIQDFRRAGADSSGPNGHGGGGGRP
jgi:indole-3-glycerol phosphate synthase